MTAAEQAEVFAAMFLCGAALGVTYDLLGAARRGNVSTAAADLFFGVLCALAITGTALALRRDAFRLYVFGGTALGFSVYMLTLGTVVRILKGIIRKRSNKVKDQTKIFTNVQENDGIERI